MLDRGGINSLIRLIHTIVNEKLLHYSRGSGGTGAPPIPPEVMKSHPLDPDTGPHTGTLPEDEVVLDDAAGHDHQGAGDTGKKVDAKDLADTDGQILTGTQKTDLTDGGATVLHAHAAGITDAVQIILTNQTGGERTAGDVVVTDPDNDESFIGTSGSGYQGKVLVVAETIATSGSGPCWERGGPFEIDVVGAVDRNDGLRTSATIYKAEAAPSVVSDGVFAIALSTSGSGGGTIKAVFLDVVSAGGGDGDGGEGAWTLIEDIELGAPAATIDFQNIPATYKHLVLEYSLRTDRAAENDGILLRFNNSAAGYDYVRDAIYHNAQLATAEGLNAAGMEIDFAPGATGQANSFSAGSVRIHDYTDGSRLPTALTQNAYLRTRVSGKIYEGQSFGQWRTLAAVNRITLLPEFGTNFVAGSRVTLYGID